MTHPYLAEYELGQSKPDKRGKREAPARARNPRSFCRAHLETLAPGGRAAVVLPDGILNNPSNDYVREFVMANFQVLAVVSLPASAFAHYGAGVKASVVFLRKRADGETPSDDEATFMAAPERIGYDATGRETTNNCPASSLPTATSRRTRPRSWHERPCRATAAPDSPSAAATFTPARRQLRLRPTVAD